MPPEVFPGVSSIALRAMGASLGVTHASVQRQLLGEELRDFIGACFSCLLNNLRLFFFQGLIAQKKSLPITFSILR